ncbi:MAG TPA: trehalose-phosphatase [Thermomicrobiales bacterium]|nr:trehalose-phosphatase [Thermomicrobiales bacterium]
MGTGADTGAHSIPDAVVGIVQAPRPRHTGPVSAALMLPEALQALRSAPARSAVLLDVDGTLAPIVRHAEDAHVPESTRSVLTRVAKAYGVVACVSGRRAATARRIVSIGSIAYVGNHGAELLRAGGSEPELEPVFAAASEEVRAFQRAEWEDGRLNRLRVRGEDKGGIVAFHWRGAPDEAAAEAAVREVARRAQDAGLWAHWGRKVLEVRPPVEVDKGRGIRRLLDGEDLDAAVYVGDDTTDLDAFAGLRALVADGRLTAAVCVGVRSDETPPELEREADLLVDGPTGVRTVLGALL